MGKTVAYGWCRQESELRKAGADLVFIDWSKERPARADMLKPGVIRDGDDFFVLAESDLGRGRDLAKQRRLLAERGIAVDVRETKRPAGKSGRPAKLDPTEEQDVALAAVWVEDLRPPAWKVRRASEIMGHEVRYDQLYYRYETRPKRQAAE